MSESATVTVSGRRVKHPETSRLRLETVLGALADPVRLSIVCALADEHEDMACVAFDLPVSKSTSTHHFRVLREAGIIRQYYAGTARKSSLRTDDLEERFPGLLPSVLNAERGRRGEHPDGPA